jgi:sulfite reductase (NADPH) flavoprotein alpha-component
MNTAPSHLLLAVVACATWLFVCMLVWRRARAKQRATAMLIDSGSDSARAPLLVAFASQTGMAENLALQTVAALQTAGVNVQLASFARLDATTLQSFAEVLLVASTYGEGDPPDAAADFIGKALPESVSLSGTRYGLLALGDRTYRNFCGFGRRLDAWLQQHGAQPMFARIDVDNGEPEALHAWWRELSHIAATADLPAWQDVPYEPWLLRERRHLNPGSAGGPVFHLELARQGAATGGWQSGDLLQIQIPADPGRPRDYSIASIPADGAVHLLVRLEQRADGTTGLASGWLTRQLDPGATVRARLRAHSQFRLEQNASRDLILIGNGTGIAGLRAHLKQRAHERAAGSEPRRHWLIFGERQAAHDALYAEDLSAWQASGLLTELDLVYSRDGQGERYVQQRLQARAAQLREWVEAGAAIYVCGSLEGMAEGVAAVLRAELGEEQLARLQHEGRYRRDVY